MMLCNHTSRYDVAIAAILGGAKVNPKVALNAHETASYVKHLIQKDREYILENGQDRPGVFDTPVFEAEGAEKEGRIGSLIKSLPTL